MSDLWHLMEQSKILLSCGLAWFLAQGVKSLLFSLKHRKFDWRAALVGTGGMPSSHSALVATLAASSFVNESVPTATMRTPSSRCAQCLSLPWPMGW